MTRGELRRRMTAREFAEWVVFYEIQQNRVKAEEERAERNQALVEGHKMRTFFAALKAKQNAQSKPQD